MKRTSRTLTGLLDGKEEVGGKTRNDQTKGRLGRSERVRLGVQDQIEVGKKRSSVRSSKFSGLRRDTVSTGKDGRNRSRGGRPKKKGDWRVLSPSPGPAKVEIRKRQGWKPP